MSPPGRPPHKPVSPEEFTLKYVITGAVAALALFVTAGSASAQHPGAGHGGGHAAPSHHPVAPLYPGGHHQGGYSGHQASGFGPGVYRAPAHGGGIGVYPTPGVGLYPGPAYRPVHPVVPPPAHGQSYGHSRGHH